nr:MAG TPA: hypothetical protein [Caudoviricetes sp.]
MRLFNLHQYYPAITLRVQIIFANHKKTSCSTMKPCLNTCDSGR